MTSWKVNLKTLNCQIFIFPRFWVTFLGFPQFLSKSQAFSRAGKVNGKIPDFHGFPCDSVGGVNPNIIYLYSYMKVQNLQKSRNLWKILWSHPVLNPLLHTHNTHHFLSSFKQVFLHFFKFALLQGYIYIICIMHILFKWVYHDTFLR